MASEMIRGFGIGVEEHEVLEEYKLKITTVGDGALK